MKRITINEAKNFHGHLGPYLILGVLAGELAVNKLKCRKYFGLEVRVRGAVKKPKSCLIDGLQLSTGATYGKGNIKKIEANKLSISFSNLKNRKKITLSLTEGLAEKLNKLKNHKDCEEFARKLHKINPSEIFHLTTGE